MTSPLRNLLAKLERELILSCIMWCAVFGVPGSFWAFTRDTPTTALMFHAGIVWRASEHGKKAHKTARPKSPVILA